MPEGTTTKEKEDTVKLNIYSIYDTAAGLYSRPFFDQADASSMRAFQDLVMDAEHPVGKHPEDYSLFRIGLFDDNTGQLSNEANSCLATALETIAAGRKKDDGRSELKLASTD